MPFALIKSISSFSSEDPSHPASSLLYSESNKKWKTLNSGEKSAYVILQLDKPEIITGIDVGNEHSAFVEILVARSGGPTDFKELILSSSFMTPFESKNSTVINRVRCFGNEKLLPTASEKWDLLKIICTQPFNKHIQYGLSFIKIHVAMGKKPKSKHVNQKTVVMEKKYVGNFKLRDDDESDSEHSSSLFDRWKESKTPENEKINSVAAQIRDLSSGSALINQSESLKPKKLFQRNKESSKVKKKEEDDLSISDRNRSEIFYNEKDEKPNEKYENQILVDQVRVDQIRKTQNMKKVIRNYETNSNTTKQLSNTDKEMAKERAKQISEDIIREVKTSVKKRLSSLKPLSSSKKRRTNLRSEIIFKPFNKLLEDVVLVISGIQNPDRADLRMKAIEMGAKYKPDWENSCTHLICAFKNTPKYNQVQKANGKIIKRTWIENCYESRKRIPWRQFALDSDEGNKSESEDEILELSVKPTDSETSRAENNSKPINIEGDKARCDLINNLDSSNDKNSISDYDTEDELEKVRNLQKLKESKVGVTVIEKEYILKIKNEGKESIKNISCTEKNLNSKSKHLDIYEISTDEEEYTKSKNNLNVLSYDFFAGKKFYIHPKTNAIDKMKLKQYIEDYKGELTGIMSESNYAISKEHIKADSEFSGEVVTPLWIYECNDMERLIPTKRYLP